VVSKHLEALTAVSVKASEFRIGSAMASSELRADLDSLLLDFFEREPEIVYAEAIGSTATHTETRYSDKDVVVVLKDDQSFNRTLSSVESVYADHVKFVDWYAYNPFHHYVVYDALEGPVPLDIYYLTQLEYFLFIHPQTVVLEGVVSSTLDQTKRNDELIDELFISGSDMIEAVRPLIQAGAYSEALALMQEYLDNKIVVLLSKVLGKEIPHIKKIDLTALDEEIAQALIACFGPPTYQGLINSIENMSKLFALLKAKQSNMSDFLPQLSETTIEPDIANAAVEMFGKQLLVHPLVKKVLWEQEHNLLGLVVNDDQNLMKVSSQVSELLAGEERTAEVIQLSPIHWRFHRKQADSEGVWGDVFITTVAHYSNLSKESRVLKGDRGKLRYEAQGTATAFEPHGRKQNKKEMLQTQLVKAMIRTFRLLSKVIKEDWMTTGYIVSAIRNGQVLPLLHEVYGDVFPENIQSLLFDTYPQPEKSQTITGIRALSLLIADVYKHLSQQYDLKSIGEFMTNSLQGIAGFSDD
jgi:predicted nucleotidyltransferase